MNPITGYPLHRPHRMRPSFLVALVVLLMIFIPGVMAKRDANPFEPELSRVMIDMKECTPPNVRLDSRISVSFIRVDRKTYKPIGCTRFARAPVKTDKVVRR